MISHIQNILKQKLNLSSALLVLLLLASLGWAGFIFFGFVANKLLASKVRAATPKVIAAVGAERDVLAKAIEKYKAQYGYYPPDHLVTSNPMIVDAVTNQLLYELTGTVYNASNQTFAAHTFQPVEVKLIRELFNIEKFRNSANKPESVKHFLAENSFSSREIHDDPDVNVLRPLMSVEGVADDLLYEFDCTPWRYVTSAPTNNPGRFDLWVDLVCGKEKVTIGNWPKR